MACLPNEILFKIAYFCLTDRAVFILYEHNEQQSAETITDVSWIIRPQYPNII